MSEDPRYTIIEGDCIRGMATLPDGSVHTCVTSPPYWGLRDYGHDDQIGMEKTPEEFVENMVNVLREVKRVLRDDGTVWLNLGDSYWSNTLSRKDAVESMWGNRPASDLTDGRDNIPKVNRRGGLGAAPEGIKPKDLVGIPWRVAFALQADGWYLRQDIIWHKPNPMPEAVTDRCTKAHEYIFLLSKSQKYYYDHLAIREDGPTYVRKASGYKGEDYVKGHTSRTGGKNHKSGFADKDKVTVGRNKRSVWTVTTKPFRGAHFATFPPDLIEPCVLAGCPEGGTVLDPFTGSGTTCVVSLKHGRKFIGTELNPEYIKIATERISDECPIPLTDLFT